MPSNSSAAIKWGAVALVVFLIGVVFWKIKTPPQVGGDVISQLPVAEQARRREDAKKVTDQVQAITQQAQRHERAPFTLVITQEQLNTLMQDGASQSGAAIHDMKGEISAGRLTFQGTVPYNGMNVIATLSGTPQVEGGKLVYHADSLLLGGVAAPENIKANAEQTATTQLNRLVNGQATLSSIKVESGVMTLEGTTN